MLCLFTNLIFVVPLIANTLPAVAGPLAAADLRVVVGSAGGVVDLPRTERRVRSALAAAAQESRVAAAHAALVRPMVVTLNRSRHVSLAMEAR